MPYNITFSINDLVYLIMIIVIGLICFNMITGDKKGNKQPKGFKKYKYRKNERIDLNKQAASRWKAKTKNQPDPEMFSNEPLTYEKAGELKTKAYNRKYHDFIQAQWDELNK